MENTVYGVFKEIVKNNKNEIAIIENDRTLTFEELSEMVDMIADSFKDGTKSVGIIMRHIAEMIAYIVSKDNNLKVSQIKKELSKDLPQFMIPEFIVKIPCIPLNENGKPDMTNMPVVLKEGNDYGNNN